ncbi:hypothetical protein [Actinacidiphila sp. ITFR-21]|uniref:hypothetical protein n=1 Tax=Actinacidiphila sp. ITFR-21 TaxID=3075199 RepID=UPI0028890AF7|nr:hypothetical protein [Streptomyces sp. ITFR-21]WNI17020.1 hypothetical protein RLT57_16825 [Streptomyces sp. ITFR-21]
MRGVPYILGRDECDPRAAFETREVTIDACSLTTETLGGALAAHLQRVVLGELNPSALHVRVLLPTRDTALALPRLVADLTDDRPLRRLRQLVRGHAITLRSAFTRLSDVRPDITCSIECKAVPATPPQKLCLLNKHVALSGYYRVIEREVTFGDGRHELIYDVPGVSTTLFHHRHDPERPHSHPSRFVTESQAWFDSLWRTIAETVTLFE